MKNTPSYLPLIAAWEQYLEISKKGDIKDFAYWLLQKEPGVFVKEEEGLESYIQAKTTEHGFAYKSSGAAILLWRLGKFIRHYTRPVLLEHGLAGQDDFGILAHVDYKKSCSKTEAIEANIIDATTGIEIIKRLVKQGLITEKPNKKDKRQRIISLTKSGQATLYSMYAGFAGIQDVLADLNVAQRETLINTLENLDMFHTRNLEALSKLPKSKG